MNARLLGNQKEKYFGFSVNISLRPFALISKNKHFYPYYLVCSPVSLKQKKQVLKSQGVTMVQLLIIRNTCLTHAKK